MAKKKVIATFHLPPVLAAQIRQIAYWAETDPEIVCRVLLAVALRTPPQPSTLGKT